MKWFLSELSMIVQADIVRMRSKLFLFLFNLMPDLFCLKYIKNFFLLLAGVKLNILFVYIKNNFYFDKASSLKIGKGVFINRNVFFEGLGKTTIGNGVQIGPHVSFITTNHKNRVQDETDDIEIGNNVWIGAGCTILPGVKIADNINIAAGSIVKGNVLDGNLWAGNPAVKKR